MGPNWGDIHELASAKKEVDKAFAEFKKELPKVAYNTKIIVQRALNSEVSPTEESHLFKKAKDLAKRPIAILSCLTGL